MWVNKFRRADAYIDQLVHDPLIADDVRRFAQVRLRMRSTADNAIESSGEQEPPRDGSPQQN